MNWTGCKTQYREFLKSIIHSRENMYCPQMLKQISLQRGCLSAAFLFFATSENLFRVPSYDHFDDNTLINV